MTKDKILVTFIILLTSKICFSQLNSRLDSNNIFSKGIYLVDKNLLIPWDINLTQLSKYGNPRVEQSSRHHSQNLVIWDSVNILNGIRVNLQIQKPKSHFYRNETIENYIFNADIDSFAYNQLIAFFDNYKNPSKHSINQENKNTYFWPVGNCLVHVRFWRRSYSLSIARSRS